MFFQFVVLNVCKYGRAPAKKLLLKVEKGKVARNSFPLRLHFTSSRTVLWDNFGAWNIGDEVILPSAETMAGKSRYRPHLRNVGCTSQTGVRSTNEDRYALSEVSNNVLCLAVFDGHGGPAAANFCSKYMAKHLRKYLQKEENLELVLSKSFLAVDREFTRRVTLSQEAELLRSGSTATVALLRDGQELAVGSVGDSRAVLCRRGKAMGLTKDHTAQRKDERTRVKACGGFVTWSTTGHSRINGTLAMTRSIGDIALKPYGVIADPEIQQLQLNHEDDSFLVLTTDGINFIMNNQEVCDAVSSSHTPGEAAHLITDSALQYGSDDNATAVVISLGAWRKFIKVQTHATFLPRVVSGGRWA
uniref:protein-serine/threonine phosphatase n=1 Tax=Petromyzon marinus TaxID=7757 RepID=S4RNX5_PETMA